MNRSTQVVRIMDKIIQKIESDFPPEPIKYFKEIKVEFFCGNAVPEPISISGDMKGLTGYALEEVPLNQMFEKLKIVPLDFAYVTELLRERNVVFKNNSMTRKDGKVIFVRSTLRRLSEFRVEETTHDIEDEIG